MKMNRDRMSEIDRMGKSHDNTYHILIQDPYEMEWVCSKIEAMKPSCIIEIGVAYGGTLRMWYEIVESGGKVIGIDPGNPIPTHETDYGVKWDMTNLSDNKKVHYVQGFSHHPETIEKVKKIVNINEADVLFIDAGHSEEEVAADYNNYFQFLRPGGMLVLCDTNENNGPAGPYKFWPKIENTLDNTEIMRGGCGTNIGYKRRV